MMNALKMLYDKSKIWFAVAWIIAYCVLMSVGYFGVSVGGLSADDWVVFLFCLLLGKVSCARCCRRSGGAES